MTNPYSTPNDSSTLSSNFAPKNNDPMAKQVDLSEIAQTLQELQHNMQEVEENFSYHKPKKPSNSPAMPSSFAGGGSNIAGLSGSHKDKSSLSQTKPSFLQPEIYNDFYQSLYKNNPAKAPQPPAKNPFADQANEAPIKSPFDKKNQEAPFFDERVNQRFSEIDNMLMAEYRDRQIKHKHLLKILDEHQANIRAIDQKINLWQENKGTDPNFIAQFEEIFKKKLIEVLQRSQQVIIDNNHAQSQNIIHQLQELYKLLQSYSSAQAEYQQRFTELEQKITFLAKQQILQQKLHTQLFALQQQKQAAPQYNHAASPAPQSPYRAYGASSYEPQPYEPPKAPQAAPPPAPAASYRPDSSYGAKNNYYSDHMLAGKAPAAAPNMPKNWQDALAQLFQSEPRYNDKNEERQALTQESAARILEKLQRAHA